MRTRIYISAPFELLEVAKLLRSILEDTGQVVVTARWLNEQLGDKLFDAPAKERRDREDMDNSDLMIAINPEEWRFKGTGGRHAEVGYMIAIGKPIYVFGAATNVFHHNPHVILVTSYFHELIKALRDFHIGW